MYDGIMLLSLSVHTVCYLIDMDILINMTRANENIHFYFASFILCICHFEGHQRRQKWEVLYIYVNKTYLSSNVNRQLFPNSNNKFLS